MELQKENTDGEVTAVQVRLADSNHGGKTPRLDEDYRGKLAKVSSQLFPEAEFKEVGGVLVPAQNTFNDCCFHTAYYQAQTIDCRHGPPAREWQRHAARLRSYVLFLAYKEMTLKGAALHELGTAYETWRRGQHPPSSAMLQPSQEVGGAAKGA